MSAANGVLKDSPGALPGGCTRDLVHRFYQEQYQIDGGKQDRYTTGSDAVGLTQGVYGTRSCRSTATCTARARRSTSIADNFFQGAFGGSFLNHQWLIAARAPVDTDTGRRRTRPRPRQLGARRERDGQRRYPQYTPTGTGRRRPADAELCPGRRRSNDESRPRAATSRSTRCSRRAPPHSEPAPQDPAHRRRGVPQHRRPDVRRRDQLGLVLRRLGRRGGRPRPVRCSSSTTSRSTTSRTTRPASPAARTSRTRRGSSRPRHATGTLPTVSFVKPYGAENEHPGYASEPDGSDHLVDLLKTITEGDSRRQHAGGGDLRRVRRPVGPRVTARHGTVGAHDAWGPGTRIPALVLSRSFKHSGVDHRSTTRPRSWPPSSTASGWSRWRPATRS